MTLAPNRSVSLEELSNFIKANITHMAAWPPGRLPEWLLYHLEEAFVCVVSLDGAEIAGVAIARPIMNPEQAADSYSFDQEGKCLYIAALVATSNVALRRLIIALIARFGARSCVAYHRKGGERFTWRPAGPLVRKILKPA